MSSAKTKRRGCWKGGCLGCAAVVALVVGAPLLLGVLGFAIGAPETDPRREDMQHALPGSAAVPQPPSTPEPPLAGESGEGGDVEDPENAPGAVERELMPSSVTLAPEVPPVPASGRVFVNLAMGEFIIVAGPQEEGIRVEADYDAGTFELIESFEPSPDGTWDYRLELESSIGWFRRIWADKDVDNEIRLVLPRGQPISLVGKLALGESEVDLTGLWLTDVDLELKTGDHAVRIDEPSPAPVDFVRIEGGMGEFRIGALGNLSPLTAKISASMGELRLDLEGDWRQDSEIEIDFGMGECTVLVPRAVALDLRRADITLGEKSLQGLDVPVEATEGMPTVHLSVTGSMGELNVDR